MNPHSLVTFVSLSSKLISIMNIYYKSSFLREFKRLPKDLQEEAYEKIELFKDTQNHKKLKVHALHGKLKGIKSFSVNYAYRILFQKKKDTIFFTAIGDHSLYN